MSPEFLRFAMILSALLAAGVIVAILLSRRKGKDAKVQAQAAVAVPAVDLADESVSAEQRKEDEWLRMADECASRGEFRLGIRAVHLAGLRYLGEKGWISLQSAKTGWEYGAELNRRLRHVPPAVEGYASGLRQYEGVWYGFEQAGPDRFLTLRATWEELRRHA